MNRLLFRKAEHLCGMGVVVLFLGSYMGNRVIAAGQFLLLFSLVLLMFSLRELGGKYWWRRLKYVGMAQFRMSLLCLSLIAVFYVLSIWWNWDLYEVPFKDFKKVRYILIPLFLLTVVRMFPEIDFRKWFGWCLISWLLSLILAGAFGLVSNIELGSVTPIPVSTGDAALSSVYQPFTLHRVAGIFGNVMSFAYSLQFSMLFLVSIVLNWNRSELCLIRRIKGIRALIWIAVPLAGICLYFSYTRGAVLGVVTGLLSMVILKKSWSLLLIVFVIGGLGAIYSYHGDKGYFRSLRNDDIRVSQWKTAALTFLKYPVFGVGYRDFEKRCAELKKEFGMPADFEGGTKWYNNHAHNNYLEAFASTGLFGGLCFLGFVGFWLAELIRSPAAKHFFVPVVTAFAVSGFFENTFTDSEVLNFVLLIYFVSQMVLDWEKRRKTHADRDAINPAHKYVQIG